MTTDLVPKRRLEMRGAAGLLPYYFHHPEIAPLEFGLWGRAGTAKSWNIVQFLIWVVHMYPNVPGRIAICRQTYFSLVSSTCVTIRKVLDPKHSSVTGTRDDHRREYHFGAWTISLFGLLNPDKLYSTEWDFVYVPEARQISKKAWEEMGRGMRNNALFLHDAHGNRVRDADGEMLPGCEPSILAHPWCPKLLDTNPGLRSSWLLKRAKDGILEFHKTTVQDNPAYWSIARNEHTAMGRAFEAQLDQLSGPRRLSLRDGVWGTAEGAIWPQFSFEQHVVELQRDKDWWLTREQLHALGIVEFFAGMDFGFNSCGVMLVGGLTKKKKLIILAEAYAPGKGVDWFTGMLCAVHQHYPITLAFCDWNEPSWLLAFNEALGVPRSGPGAIAVRADKGIDRGLDIVRRRMIDRTIVFDSAALMHDPDSECIRRQIPFQTIDAIEGYIYQGIMTGDDEVEDDSKPRTEKPDKKRSHSDGPDALRYLCVGVQNRTPETELADPKDTQIEQRFKNMLLRTLRPNRRGEYVDPEDEVNTDDMIDSDQELAEQIRRAMDQ